MNKKERKALADKIRSAAKKVEDNHYYTCSALMGLRMPYLIDWAVTRLYRELFKPDNRSHMDPWFGSLRKSIRVRNEYRSVNNKEAHGHRVVALCLLADIIEEEGVLMKLSKLFERAINESLWDGVEIGYRGKERYSCCAVEVAAGLDGALFDEAVVFLQELGLDTMSTSQYFHPYYETDEEVQQARALWLTWAAMIAKEEGV